MVKLEYKCIYENVYIDKKKCSKNTHYLWALNFFPFIFNRFYVAFWFLYAVDHVTKECGLFIIPLYAGRRGTHFSNYTSSQ